MKKNILIVFIAVTVLCLSGCSGFSVPDKVEVKASPTVETGFGSKEIVLSEVFSKADLQEAFSTAGLEVFEYKPVNAESDESVKATTFIALFRLFDFPIDIGSQLNGSDLTEDFASSMDDITFTMPSIVFDSSSTTEIPAIFYSTIQSARQGGLATVPYGIINFNIDATINLSRSENATDYNYAIVKDGKIKISVPLPGTWTGVQSKTLKIRVPALNIDSTLVEDPAESDTYILSLDGKTLPGDLAEVDLNGTFTITPNPGGNSTVSTNITSNSFPITFAGDVTSFSEISVPATEKIPATKSISQQVPLPKDFTDSVTSISFVPTAAIPNSELALTISLDNPLSAVPGNSEANAIDVKIVSTSLNIDKDGRFSANANEKIKAIANLPENKLIPNNLVKNDNGCATLDFDIDITLPNDGAGNIVLHNIVAGETITFNSDIDFTSNWSFVSIDGSRLGTSGTFPENEPLNTDDLFSVLPEGIQFKSIPMHIYIGGLDSSLFDKNAVNLSANISVAGEPNSLYDGGIDLVDKLPDFQNASVVSGETPYTGAIPDDSIPGTDKDINIADIINGTDEMQLTYNISVGDITITNPGTEVAGTAKLQALIALELPLEIAINGTESIAFSDKKGVKFVLMESDKDLLGRGTLNGNNEDTEYLDYLESGSITINVNSNSIGLEDVSGYFVFGGTPKSVSLSPGQHTIELNKDDVTYIRDNFCKPEFGLFMPNTNGEDSIMLNLDGLLSISITGSLSTSIDKTISF